MENAPLYNMNANQSNVSERPTVHKLVSIGFNTQEVRNSELELYTNKMAPSQYCSSFCSNNSRLEATSGICVASKSITTKMEAEIIL